MVIAIYCRKSVYKDTSESITNQIEMCKDFIIRNYGPDNTILIYDKDEGISGATTDRPCFQKMMDDVTSGIIEMVVCYMIDRISRNIKDFCNIYFTFQEHNCRFVSVKENIDDTTAMGRAMLYICQVFANLERDNIRERIIDNMTHLEQLGYWASGLAPFGYYIDKISVNGKKHSVLKIDEEKSNVYLHMVDLFLNQNLTLYYIEKELLSEGYRTRKGAILDSSRIWKILSNPSYMCADQTAYNYFKEAGCQMLHDKGMFDGKHAIMVRGRFKHEGTKVVITDKSEWRIFVGMHEPLISSADWIAIQDKFKGNVYSKRKRTNTFGICSGVLRCKCGYSMRSKSKVYAPTGRAYTAYVCTRKENKGRGECDSHMIKCSVIDEAVIEKLKEISVNKESLVAFAYKDTPKPIYNVKQLEKRLKTLTTEIKSLTTALVDAKNSTARKYIIEEIENKDEEKASINAKLTEAKVIDLQEVKNNAYLDKVYDNIQMLLNNFDNLDDEAKNQLIKSIVKEIVVSDESISITI